jgi:hypothetical protein
VDAEHRHGQAAQRRHLARGTLDIGRIRIGHRLNDNRRPATHRDAANLNRDSFVTHRCVHQTDTRPIPQRNQSSANQVRDCSEFR